PVFCSELSGQLTLVRSALGPGADGNTQVDQGASASSTAVEKKAAQGSDRPAGKLEEVVITAQKRTERVQDVPVPVTAISADTLAENNQPLLRDYFTNVPGFIVSPGGGSSFNQQITVVRGISSGGYGVTTVGVTIDDVPYGAFIRELTP